MLPNLAKVLDVRQLGIGGPLLHHRWIAFSFLLSSVIIGRLTVVVGLDLV